LAGVRVVSVEQAVSAPLCTRHLADLGAEVIKVERPVAGDFARGYDSVVMGQSAYFVWLNQGKRSLVLDLRDQKGRAELETLLGSADVLVHNMGPRAATSAGLSWDLLHARWPNLIVCGISGYGADGPYRDRKAYDLLLQGESGLLSVTGTPDEPVKVGISIADICAGMYAFSSILACLYERERTGESHYIDISMLECIAEWMMVPALHERYAGHAPPRTGLRHNLIVPYGPYPTRDGLVNLAVQNDEQWDRFCTLVLEDVSLSADPRFAGNEQRVANRSVLEPAIERVLGDLPRQVVLERLDRADLPSGALNSVSDLLRHPQLAQRDRWRDVPSPGGPVRVLRHPMNISGLTLTESRIPALDGDHADVMTPPTGIHPGR
jgi:crotonobetainyl-CoA:carnitine CoA-transferase CaiB-like acyl-CoA transferase